MICHHSRHSQLFLGVGNSERSLKSPAFLEFIHRLEMVPLLAHHPACQHYHHHIIWLGKLPLCLGCSMMACGMVAGILLIPHLHFVTSLPFYILMGVGVFLYIPALLQIKIQFKPYKMLARFLLGVAVVFLFYAGLWLTPRAFIGWILKLGFLASFYIVWNLTLKIRSRYSKSPCDRCPEGRFPVCSYTIPRISKLANKYFSESDGSDAAADDFVRALQSVRSP